MLAVAPDDGRVGSHGRGRAAGLVMVPDVRVDRARLP
jgi:hypothetical protein